MGGRRRCCCEEECPIFDDDFNRGSTTDVDGWTELAGDSELVSNELQVPSSGVIRENTPHPHNSQTGHVTVDLVDVQNGDKWEIRIGVDVNGNNGDYAQIRADATHLYLSINGGSEEQAKAYTAGDTVGMNVCRGFDSMWIDLNTSVAVWECVADDNTTVARYVALANWGGSSPVLFDNFTYIQHYQTNVDCFPCGCGCQEFCVPKTLTLTFTATNDCSDLDGETITLTYDPIDVTPCVWSGNADLFDWETGSGTINWSFTLRHNGGCGTDSGQDGFILCIISGSFDVGWIDNYCPGNLPGQDDNSCVCDPLVVEFGPFHASTSEPLECDFSLTLTV